MQSYNQQQQQAIILKGIAQQILSMNVPSYQEVNKMLGQFDMSIVDKKASRDCTGELHAAKTLLAEILELFKDRSMDYDVEWLEDRMKMDNLKVCATVKHHEEDIFGHDM